MKQIQRLQEVYKILKMKKVSLEGILSYLNEKEIVISTRQLQRDLKDINPLLKNNESLITHRNSKRVKYFYIINNSKNSYKSRGISSKIRVTNFNEAKLNPTNNRIIESLMYSIENNFSILINNLLYDSTGDNHTFTESNIRYLPIEIIFHRGTHYVGGFNIEKKIIQIFEINQLKKIQIVNDGFSKKKITDLWNRELLSRFGISRNINNETYDIKLEFSSGTGNFIMNHFWHESQNFTIQKGKVIMNLHCGINRELMGWLFYWMYNVKIKEPEILKDYYQKTIKEINLVNSDKNPLVYKNIFNS